MPSLISIIIPYYNQPKELRLALNSIIKQTYKNIEIIIVDDGSHTLVIPSEVEGSLFFTPNDKIKIIHQSNHGAPLARNRGLDEAKGEYIIFWDADVVAEAEMLEKMINALHSNPQASFAYSNYKFGFKKMHSQQFNNVTIRQLNYIHSTSLIRRTDVIRWDESLKKFQDWDLWLSLAENGKKGIWIDEYLFKVIPGGTMSAWLPSFVYQEPWRRLPWIRDKVKKYEEAKKIIYAKHQLG